MKQRGLLALIVLAVLFSALTVYADPAAAAEEPELYWLKVNRKANVVTVYRHENGKYVPFKAMICSTGAPGSETPLMTSKVALKFRWCFLVGDVWGQYCTQIKGDYLFHSVYYDEKGRKDTLHIEEYNKLGTSCSKGCVRLTVMDAKWIYENCDTGTKVTVYSSDDPGPLGKPEALKLDDDCKWDPTDPDRDNPEFNIRKPVITISEKKPNRIECGDSYNLLKYVTATDVNTFQDLTSLIKVYSIRKWNGKKWVKAEFNTNNAGKYNITYRVYSKYCGDPSYASFVVKVTDSDAPKLSVPEERVVATGDKNAVTGVTAAQKSRDRTGAVKVSISGPGVYENEMTYVQAKEFVFGKAGDYFVTYSVSNYYPPYRKTTERTLIRCRDSFTCTLDHFIFLRNNTEQGD